MERRPLMLRAAGRLFRPVRSAVEAISKIGVYSDYKSLRVHDQLLAHSSELSAPPLCAIRVRALNNERVYCRPKTTDVSVFDDTFFGRYHLPPRELKSIRTILDLGSNIGLTVAHYAVLFPKSRILGIELDKDNHEVCLRNIEPFRSRCRVIHGGVWIAEGFIGYSGDTNWGFSITEQPTGERTVQTYTMMQLLDSLAEPVVDFVKMDVEGTEAKLLDGAEAWLAHIRCLKVEIHEPYTVEQCLSRLEGQGMSCSRDVRHRACVIAWNPRHQ
jgi:FkbM family methyltransferase